jgi:uncharacterized Tic20 family protein
VVVVPTPGAEAVTRRYAVEGADRGMAVLAHASIGFGFVGIGFLLGLAINAVIWLRSRRSSYVNVHAEQAGAYQLAVLLINVALVVVWLLILVYVFVGDSEVGPGQLSLRQIAAGLWLALIPPFAVWYVGTILYGLYGALRVAHGREFWYPVFGAWARRRAGYDR